MKISYRTDVIPEKELVVDLYKSSRLNRPVEDKERIGRMYANSNLVITAWDEETLVGVARSLTDNRFLLLLLFVGFGSAKRISETWNREGADPENQRTNWRSNHAIAAFGTYCNGILPCRRFSES